MVATVSLLCFASGEIGAERAGLALLATGERLTGGRLGLITAVTLWPIGHGAASRGDPWS